MGARVHWDARRKKWFVRVDDAGRQHKQYVGADRDEAQAVADVINADLERVNQERDGRGIAFRIGGPVNGEDALRWWYATYRFKRATRDLHRGRIENHLIPHFGTMDLRRLATLHIRHYADARFGAGASPHTVKGEVSILRRVLNALVENGIFERNPLPKIMAPVAESARAHPDPERRGLRDAWTAEEAWVLMDVARDSLSPATRRAYRGDIRAFEAWCRERGVPAIPAAPEAVASFLAHEAQRGLAVSSISRRAAAIRLFHRAAGHATPTESEIVRSTLRGIRRTLGVAPKQKKPLTGELLISLLEHIPDSLRGKRDRALLLLGFAGAFRRSTLAMIEVEDLEEVADGLRVQVRRSKTDQEGQGESFRSFEVGGRAR